MKEPMYLLRDYCDNNQLHCSCNTSDKPKRMHKAMGIYTKRTPDPEYTKLITKASAGGVNTQCRPHAWHFPLNNLKP